MAADEIRSTPFDAAVVELQAKADEINSTLATLLRLQAEYGGAPPPKISARGGESEISHDSFFGMTIGDAAKKYLSMVKMTKSTAEIAEALEKGGLKHSSKDFEATVRSILGPREDFTRVPNGDWGLSDWYPGQGRGKKPKAEKPKRKVSPKKTRFAKKPESVGNAEKTSAPEPISKLGTQARIEAYLATHPTATARDIANALNIRIQTVILILGKMKPASAA